MFPIEAALISMYFKRKECLSPNKSLDGGAHHAGEQEEWGDQDVKQGQGGKGHSWRQIGVLRDVNMNHKRLQKEREDRAAQGQLKQIRSFSRKSSVWQIFTGGLIKVKLHLRHA